MEVLRVFVNGARKFPKAAFGYVPCRVPRVETPAMLLCASPAYPPPPLWATDACARPVLFSTKQKCKGKVKKESFSVTCRRCLSRKT